MEPLLALDCEKSNRENEKVKKQKSEISEILLSIFHYLTSCFQLSVFTISAFCFQLSAFHAPCSKLLPLCSLLFR